MRQFRAKAIQYSVGSNLASLTPQSLVVHLTPEEFAVYQGAADKTVEVLFSLVEGEVQSHTFAGPTSLMQVQIGDAAPYWELIFKF